MVQRWQRILQVSSLAHICCQCTLFFFKLILILTNYFNVSIMQCMSEAPRDKFFISFSSLSLVPVHKIFLEQFSFILYYWKKKDWNFNDDFFVWLTDWTNVLFSIYGILIRNKKFKIFQIKMSGVRCIFTISHIQVSIRHQKNFLSVWKSVI